ncbi:probable pectinesterase/pectinesterase inhibitor 7 [Impatiens glandulifera]|uniref:probable pectinesterase/pectinesterase inhibitor 7 n=1 Tax=Impatiens glandulifera TaxID=253017 RepID=UPI001FB09048|nr:probable pectinesterase/pectinesterase inhibitor 7 [Impatiens glandulifera]
MVFSLSLSSFLSLLLIIMISFFSINLSSAEDSTTICKSTPDPSFCRTVLPNNNSSANVYDYGRFSVKKSISSARKFQSLIEMYLRNPSALTPAAIAALLDCRLLAGLNIDYLNTAFATVGYTSKTLPVVQADNVQTFLSAILTNVQTCLDGIQSTAQSWRSKNGVVSPLAADAKLFSVSLALITKGWVPKIKKGPSKPRKKHLTFQNGKLNVKMNSQQKAIFEAASRRNLQQTNTTSDMVLVNDIVVVSQDGSGNFTAINDAIAAAPNNTAASDGYFLIYVTAGVYQEYVSIAKNKKYLMMVGDGINQTIITGNHSVVDGWTTFNSATFAVVGLGFVGMNLTIRNTAGAIKHQAVALRNGADLSTFYGCSFEAYQDTLYVHSLRQFYTECDVYGTVDFIFGNAAVVLQNCNMYPRMPMSGQFNAITAQGRTDPNQNTGISIQKCTIKAADDLAPNVGTVNTYLGRPWKLYSRTVYMDSFMDSLIKPLGWREWDGDFALNTSYYAEYNNRGPGSDTSGRVTWTGYHIINATDAGNFTVANFLLGNDWLPQVGVPYTDGL